MLLEDVQMLRCVDCGGDLHFDKGETTLENVISHGVLGCILCRREFPILDEVGIFFRKEVVNDYISEKEQQLIDKYRYSETLFGDNKVVFNKGHKKQMCVSKNWEYQWESVLPFGVKDLEKDNMLGNRLFLTYIPIEASLVHKKVVFIACGGRGREAYHVLKHSPTKVLVNELGTEIYSIKKVVNGSGKKLILLRSDISYHPVKDRMADISICDHALQHVFNHKLAFSKLASATKSGGFVSVCVYSYENNFLMTHIIEKIKGLLHSFPLVIQRYMAFIPATIVYMIINLIYLPFSKIPLKSINAVKHLPLYGHLIFWSTSPFYMIWTACFDLIHAPISYHFKKEEMIALSSDNHLGIIKLINTHGTTWSLVAKKFAES